MKKRVLLIIILCSLILLPIKTQSNPNISISPNLENILNSQSETSVVVFFKDSNSIKRNSKEILSDIKDNDIDIKYEFQSLNGFSAKLNKNGLAKLKQNPNVESVSESVLVRAFLPESSPMINATRVYPLQINNLNLTGQDQTVCVIDSGVDYTLAGMGGCFGANCKVVDGYNFVDDEVNPMDDNGHGTHVATIAAGNDTTYKGIAPDADIIALKVLNHSGVGDSTNIISAIDWCISNKTVYNITSIVLSLGTDSLFSSYCTDSLATAANDAVDNGLFVAVATGNDGSSTGISSPACAEKVTSVSSVNDGSSGTVTDAVTGYNTNSITDILAPGKWISSNVPPEANCANTTGQDLCDDSNVLTVGGTSQSAPHVAGAAALLIQYNKLENLTSKTPQQLEDAMKNSSITINDTRNGIIFPRLMIHDALIQIDDKAPELIIDHPLNQTYPENTANLSLNFTANDMLLDSTFYSFDNAANTTLSQNSTLAVTEGSHTLIVYSNDSAGNINKTEITFFVQGTGVILESPSNTQNISTSNLTFRCHGIAENIIDNITVYHNLGGVFQANQTTSTSNTSVAVEFQFNNTEDNNYTWNCLITENNNTQSFAENNFTFTLDSTNPVISSISIPRIYMQNFTNLTITVNASDITTGISNVTAEGEFLNLSNGLYQGSITLSSAPLDIIVTDYANNILTNSSTDYVIDNLPPNRTNTDPANQATNVDFDQNITINISETLNETTISPSNIVFQDANNNSVSFTLTYVNNQTIIDPVLRLEANQTFTVNLTSSLKDLSLNNFNSSILTFTTKYFDSDNDGTDDSEDSDDDNDGIADDYDYLTGNETNVYTNFQNLELIINGSSDTAKEFNLSTELRFFDSTDEVLDFTHSFTNTSRLILQNVSLLKQNSSSIAGAILVKGLEGITKTAYIDNLTIFHGVCAKLESVDSLDDISSDCSGSNEYFVPCPGSNNGITCTTNSSKLKISGLTQSAVVQKNDTVAPSVSSISVAYSNNITVTLSVTTSETATCRFSTSNLGYGSMTDFDSTGSTSHSNQENYNEDTSGTYYVRCQDSYGNTMSSSSTVAFNADVTETASSDDSSDSTTSGDTASGTSDDTTDTTETTEETEEQETTVDILETSDTSTEKKTEQKEYSFNFSRKELVDKIEANSKLKAGLKKILGSDYYNFVTKDTPKILEKLSIKRELEIGEVSTLKVLFSYVDENESLANFIVYDEVPKEFANSTNDLEISAEGATITIIEEDPVLMFFYDSIEANKEYTISYTVQKTVDNSILNNMSEPYFFVRDSKIPKIINKMTYIPLALGVFLIAGLVLLVRRFIKKRRKKKKKKIHKKAVIKKEKKKSKHKKSSKKKKSEKKEESKEPEKEYESEDEE